MLGHRMRIRCVPRQSSNTRESKTNSDGFTLIELAVAVAISGLLSVVLGAIVIRLLVDVPRDRANLAASEDTRTVVDTISTDIHRAKTLAVTDGGARLLLTYQPDASTTVLVDYLGIGNTLDRTETTNGSGTSTRAVITDLGTLTFDYSTSTSLLTASVTVNPDRTNAQPFSTTWSVMTRVTPS